MCEALGGAHPECRNEIINAGILQIGWWMVDVVDIIQYAEYGRDDGQEAGKLEQVRSNAFQRMRRDQGRRPRDISGGR